MMGYASDAFDYCCQQEQVQLSFGDAAPGHSGPGESHDCQCLCHQLFSSHPTDGLRIGMGILEAADQLQVADEFPPDAMPLGIDYPPQLA